MNCSPWSLCNSKSLTAFPRMHWRFPDNKEIESMNRHDRLRPKRCDGIKIKFLKTCVSSLGFYFFYF